MTVTYNLADQHAVVTGYASGIGAALTQLLVESGATVTGLDVNRGLIDPAVSHLTLDLGDREGIERVTASLPPVCMLFNCAAVSGGSGRSEDDIYAINFLGLRLLVETVAPSMPSGSAIVSVASIAGLDYEKDMEDLLAVMGMDDWTEVQRYLRKHRDPRTGPYGFGKECLIVYTMWRSARLAQRGVRINCISPTPVDTPIVQNTLKIPGNAGFIDNFPFQLGRISTPQEQASVMMFLNSDAASYITGQNIWTDGGYLGAVASRNVAPYMGRDA